MSSRLLSVQSTRRLGPRSGLSGVRDAAESQPDRSEFKAANALPPPSIASSRLRLAKRSKTAHRVDGSAGHTGRFGDDQLGAGRRWPGCPIVGWLDFGGRDHIQEDAGQVDAGDAIDHAMVDFGDDRESIVLEPFDHPQLPKRFGSIELLGDDPSGEELELLVSAGPGEARVSDVVVEIEVIVVYPNRMTGAGHVCQPLPVSRGCTAVCRGCGP